MRIPTFLDTLPLVLLTGLFFACSGNGQTGITGANAPAGDAAPASGSASFSAIVDGVRFSSSTGTDNLNAAFRIKDDNGVKIFFMLADPDNPVQKLNFELPDKEGSATISILPKYSFEGYVTKDWIPYLDDGVTVNVTSVSTTRVSGTFSGTYQLEKGKSPTAKPTIQVTDGKFDIPFSTSASWKKMYHAE
jgi:hypothetical protein